MSSVGKRDMMDIDSIGCMKSSGKMLLEDISSPIGDVTMVIPPMVYRNSLTVPTSPFFISDNGMSTYRDEPPSYNEIVDRGVSPVPCQPKVALPEV
ncbi:hypothetical protein GCK72_009376 [Caenorhabditis remanei]|uniref:Uncharacterized protein n=1 Tax=Caenorhabditis remanei TaxID=31234 RepID=A0A6A5H3R9_CAERE|nr:hypothetical protein GCK72_009376 [Caenorhabditis remanei]KAF1761122.1 hypothetical protein GCK72_009376 [Caenorhabditis remanei]